MPSGVYKRTPEMMRLRKIKFLEKFVPWNKGKKTGKLSGRTKQRISKARKGVKHSEETKSKISASHVGMRYPNRSGEKSDLWKVKVTYAGIHAWIARVCGRPLTCVHCNQTGLPSNRYHWANISGEYKRDVTDWLRLCAKCHWEYDREDRLKKLEALKYA